MILVSVIEAISIGSIFPFLGVLINPEAIKDSAMFQNLTSFFGFPLEMITPFSLTLVFCLLSLLAGMARLQLMWAQTRFSMAIGAEYSSAVFENTLHQPYEFHIGNNSSEIIAGVNKAQDLVSFAIQPALIILSSSIIISFIVAMLIALDPWVAFGSFLGFSLIYLLIIVISRHWLRLRSQKIASGSVEVIKTLQEGLGGIRDVLIDNTQSIFTAAYKKTYMPFQMASADIQILSTSPRFVVESLGMILMASIAYHLTSQDQDVVGAIPLLGVLALAAQRLLPLIQQLFSSLTTIQGRRESISDAVILLEMPRLHFQHDNKIFPKVFGKKIEFCNMGFRYKDTLPWVLRNVNLCVPKGSRVGVIGVTGGGKSTFLDLAMGLLSSSEGNIIVDGIEMNANNQQYWQSQIAHVPQFIYLADKSVAENIAFGIAREEIDMERVKDVCRKAQVSETIEGLAQGYETFVGERGIKLSGGQRQRIGIARALYKNASIIFLDEATSALDTLTEAAVIDSLMSSERDLTIFMVAHRLSTLRGCDFIVEIAGGALKITDNLSNDVKLFI